MESVKISPKKCKIAQSWQEKSENDSSLAILSLSLNIYLPDRNTFSLLISCFHIIIGNNIISRNDQKYLSVFPGHYLSVFPGHTFYSPKMFVRLKSKHAKKK